MQKLLLIPKQIVTVNKKNEILFNECVEVTDGIITKIGKYSDDDISNFNGEVSKKTNLTLIPGFVQTHIHLCQTLFRGLADDLELLDWLQLKIFPFENAHNKESLRASVRLGINELLLGGTTTILDMGTLRYQEVIFDELIKSGMRCFAGKCMMDINDLFPAFKSNTKDELKDTFELAKSFHNINNGKVKYGFAPRFALSCSEELLIETSKMMSDFRGSLYHTHSSENNKEIEEVRKKYKKDNIDFFNSLGLLSDKTILAHGIHVNENEFSILKKQKVNISHCPSSNLKLGSGIANISRYLKEGISVSLGADGAPCNNELNIFTEMRLAALIQKPIHGATVMDAKTVFRMATIIGAKALGLGKEIGSIEVGKKADLVLMDLETPFMSLINDKNNIYSKIVYTAGRNNIDSVMVEGEWLVKDKKSLLFDQQKLRFDGKTELKKLLSRI
ncbi:MAG: N-ethylammeline chlorohydrolase [Ignavibacteriales bacterium CG_4_9_14_3_um_filter_30_11]|nr:MAG: N-ethylammeline chlorohydrolase [Ignavibacteriales bacterium CG_4_9_14_3_um_filter_30_11]